MSPRGSRTGKVARVSLEPPRQGDLFVEQEERVRSAFVPGTSATRYGRTWLMGQVREEDGFLYGRIGFEAEGGVTEVWDPVRLDFAEVAIPSGVTSPFALRLSDLVMVFQTRGAIIKINTFIGAMQALLHEATGDHWLLVTTRRRVDFATWRVTVDRVTRARFHLERPNPNYE